MGIIRDKLDEQWAAQEADLAILRATIESRKEMFLLVNLIQKFYFNLLDDVSSGAAYYPTGVAVFDSYVGPIVQDMVSLKNKLETTYGEFIHWQKP